MCKMSLVVDIEAEPRKMSWGEVEIIHLSEAPSVTLMPYVTFHGVEARRH